jgi:hypothetical protein
MIAPASLSEILDALPAVARSTILDEIAAAYRRGRSEALVSETDRAATPLAAHAENAPMILIRDPARVLALAAASNSVRLRMRNDSLCLAIAVHFADLPPSSGAKALSEVWSRYLASPKWGRDREFASLPDAVDPLRRQLHALSKLNNGEPLGWRQVLNVID